MRNAESICLAGLLAIAIMAPAAAGEAADSAAPTAGTTAGSPPATEPVGPKLPDHVRSLLRQEMIAILGASQSILDALVRGQHDRVAEKAQAIHDSFILQQEMTQADRKALMEAVPKAFVERDRAFHALTGQLAEAARERDAERERTLFGRMIDACAECHARYAHDRFPGLRH